MTSALIIAGVLGGIAALAIWARVSLSRDRGE